MKEEKKTKLTSAKERYPFILSPNKIIFPSQTLVIEVGKEISINTAYIAQDHFDNYLILGIDDNVGTAATLCSFTIIKKNDNGSLQLKATGVKRVKINELLAKENDPTTGLIGNFVIIKSIKDVLDRDSSEEQALVRKIIKDAEKIISNREVFPLPALAKLNEGIRAAELVDIFAQHLPLPLATKQRILLESNVLTRIEIIIEEIEKEKTIEGLESQITGRVNKKIGEGQREFYLREKLQAIKEELGELSSKDQDIDKLRQRLKKNPYPERIKIRVEEELKKLEVASMGSPDINIIRAYVDWLLDLPWFEQTKETEDLLSSRAVLDKYHYGLVKIKERIIEYLAVQQKTKSLAGPILCLVGAPGIGKTSLAKSIAEATGRNYIRMALGGLHDEAEIRGHRKTYIGAMPGRILQSMKRVKTINPLFLLDEIDKLGRDYQGDPSSALLEVLDPEQNKYFIDNYLEETYDLSNVLFVATANARDGIPAPLQDRMEIIDLASYTELEKLNISIKYLIPKVLVNNGLNAEQLVFSNEIIYFLIRHYTKEAGVRQLERVLSQLARKIVVKIMLKQTFNPNITIAEISDKDALGPIIFDYNRQSKTAEIGVITGLAWTPYGGDILPIEVNYFDGKGELILTGQLGNVMKESASIALDYIRANIDDFVTTKKLDLGFFLTHNFHIHVPEGAVQKDGPSAGVTITTAIISAINQTPIQTNIAMTGEITLRGNVLPIGGLKEKLISARRSGVTKVFIPKENERDLMDVPEEILKELTIIPVTTYNEIYLALFKQT